MFECYEYGPTKHTAYCACMVQISCAVVMSAGTPVDVMPIGFSKLAFFKIDFNLT